MHNVFVAGSGRKGAAESLPLSKRKFCCVEFGIAAITNGYKLGLGTSRTGLSFPSDIRSTCLLALEYILGVLLVLHVSGRLVAWEYKEKVAVYRQRNS